MLLYQIKHIESGKRYIGQTTRNLHARKTEHICELRKNKHGNRHLQASWNKYGEVAFVFEVISKHRTILELDRAEIEYIKNNTNLYNLDRGGKGHKHSKDAKLAIGESSKLPIVGMNIKTQEIKEYRSAADAKLDGFNEKCIRKCVVSYISSRKDGTTFESISHRGWVWISKEEFSKEILERKRDKAKIAKVRKERMVIGMDISTKEIVTFKSASEAARNGFSSSSVYQACVGTRVKSHLGFVWTFADIEEYQSLLYNRREAYQQSPPITGPKKRKFMKTDKGNQ